MAGRPGLIIGSSWLTGDGRRTYLHHFAIHPDYQGRSLSKRLMDSSMAYCREAGLQVKLEVHADNFKAMGLYKSYGFGVLENYRVLIKRDIK